MKIPQEILEVITQLTENNFEAYLVGGCVRDLLLGREPKDWDIATKAKPEEIQVIFPQSVYENQFGTVSVKTASENPSLKIIEITTFRQDVKYSDKRHPDAIKFAQTIEEDLSRRDFTINAIALQAGKLAPSVKLIDPFGGQVDLKKKLIRTVGDSEQRFEEDALRLMRAIRLACELDFQIEDNTFKAIRHKAALIRFIAKERIRDEFIKIIDTPRAQNGIVLLQETTLLHEIIPELEQGIGVTQNKHHRYTVYEHLLRSLDYAASKDYNRSVRLAALFHDIGKPKVKEGEGLNSTFYNHEIVSAKMTAKILSRLKFSKEESEKIIKLVRYHGFVYDPEITTDASVRRLLIKVGKDNIRDLAQLREADRIGSGCPKALPFRLRHFLFRVEKILKESSGEQPSLKMLKINGHDIMETLKIPSGPKIGALLSILLEEVLDDPKKNTQDYLLKRAQELNKLSELELKKKEKLAQAKYKNLLAEEETKIKQKYRVD